MDASSCYWCGTAPDRGLACVDHGGIGSPAICPPIESCTYCGLDVVHVYPDDRYTITDEGREAIK